MNRFSRRGDPLLIPLNADGSPSQADARAAPAGPRPANARLFYFQNPNPFYVALRGSSTALNQGFQPAEDGKGWLLPPHSTSEVFRTQNPDWMSVVAVDKADVPAFTPEGALRYAEPIVVQYGD